MPKEKLINTTRFTSALDKAKRYTDKAISAITKFLPLTGGTMSNTNLVNNLNAEFLGGKNLAWMYKNMTLDLTGLDQDTWYPVTIGPLSLNCGVYRFQIIALLDSETSPYKVDWATHKSGTFTARLIWESNGSGWGASLVNRRVHDFEFLFCKDNVTPIGGLTQMEHTSRELVYLRGGGKYYFTSQYDVAVTIHKTSVTYNGETAAPVNTAPEAPEITASSAPSDYDLIKEIARSSLPEIALWDGESEPPAVSMGWDEFQKNTPAVKIGYYIWKKPGELSFRVYVLATVLATRLNVYAPLTTLTNISTSQGYLKDGLIFRLIYHPHTGEWYDDDGAVRIHNSGKLITQYIQ